MSAIRPDPKTDPDGGHTLALSRAERLEAIRLRAVQAQGLQPVMLDKQESDDEEWRQALSDEVPVIDLGSGGATLDPLAGVGR